MSNEENPARSPGPIKNLLYAQRPNGKSRSTTKKMLVVSDNPRLTRFFQQECARQEISGIAEITFFYSAVNKHPLAMKELGATVLDLKEPKTVASLVDSCAMIFSLHCKQIFPAELVEAVTCVNVHPGLNPYNRGWYPQVFSIINGAPIGATIHLMDADVDHGGIIAQEGVEVRASDTSLEVYEKVIQVEMKLVREHLGRIVSGDFVVTPVSGEGNYNSINDFKSLCSLDLKSVGSLRDHIRLLRALSHGTFRNAFFRDEQGRKIFIRVSLEEEI